MNGPTTTTPPPTATTTINATPQIAFSPPQVTVTQGGAVTFSYCHIHPGMRGTITVVAPDTL